MTRERIEELDVELEIVSERTSGEAGDFLWLRHRQLRLRPGDGDPSPPFQCDSVRRPMGMDAVAMVIHRTGPDGEPRVGLRASLRPAIALDGTRRSGAPAPPRLWELPAGIVEAGDEGDIGLRRRCSAEALEEMGATVAPEAWRPLGAPIWLSPGVIAERIYLYEAALENPQLVEPEGDGSPMESGAAIVWLPVAEALGLCREGLTDAKTEVALQRFLDARSRG